ncbi:MAG TPA: NADH-ubiquinone oxidoreductase-F iron-sulfur binding region domain-containing protein [Mycobacteriales bacterium]|nr:NADH-ubiquinone oxidoreductase-F iron-sulfur binding region domain-containing protein [Mycobacteriales bacterium]
MSRPAPPAPAAHDPRRLLAAPGARAERRTLAGHRAGFGPTPYLGGPHRLTEAVQAAGLTGRGGACFPTARKLHAVAAASGRAVVVGNGAEGEPASSKDRVLLAEVPHLVLDGIQVAAEAVRARQAYLYLAGVPALVTVVRAALAERAAARTDLVPVELVPAPVRYLAGEESAVTARISGAAAKPRFTPPRVFERGVRGRPTLVQNVETLAHIALVARYGPAWFRALGTPDEPGTMLCTVSGAVARPTVVEVPVGTPLRDVLGAAGGGTGPLAAVLLGGYHGSWLAGAPAADLRLCNADLRPHGATVGSGVVVALPENVCGVVETARVARYLADQAAGQCGPCRNGLPLLADTLAALAGTVGTVRFGPHPLSRMIRGRVDQLTTLVDGRGACHHPDGTVRLVRSALRVFGPEIARHEHGDCVGRSAPGLLPVPPLPAGPDSWW